jgi:hypothetical protein
MYAAFLGDWAPRFPRRQILMLRLEDYSAAPRRHLEALFAHAGLRQPTEAEWPAILRAPAANTRGGGARALAGAPEEMLSETRELLREFYAPFNTELAALVGDARFQW